MFLSLGHLKPHEVCTTEKNMCIDILALFLQFCLMTKKESLKNHEDLEGHRHSHSASLIVSHCPVAGSVRSSVFPEAYGHGYMDTLDLSEGGGTSPLSLQ